QSASTRFRDPNHNSVFTVLDSAICSATATSRLRSTRGGHRLELDREQGNDTQWLLAEHIMGVGLPRILSVCPCLRSLPAVNTEIRTSNRCVWVIGPAPREVAQWAQS